MQLMSELVRKAEADIDVLRTRLAAVDVPPLTSAAAQSDALLQVSWTSTCCASNIHLQDTTRESAAAASKCRVSAL